jgi:hypothetical protein
MIIDEELKDRSWVQTTIRQTLLVAADRHIPNYSIRPVRSSRGNEAQSVFHPGTAQPQPKRDRLDRSACDRDFLGLGGSGTTPTVNVTESLDHAKKGFFY